MSPSQLPLFAAACSTQSVQAQQEGSPRPPHPTVLVFPTNRPAALRVHISKDFSDKAISWQRRWRSPSVISASPETWQVSKMTDLKEMVGLPALVLFS